MALAAVCGLGVAAACGVVWGACLACKREPGEGSEEPGGEWEGWEEWEL